MPSLARSVPKPLKVPSLARSVPKPLKVPSLARSEVGGFFKFDTKLQVFRRFLLFLRKKRQFFEIFLKSA